MQEQCPRQLFCERNLYVVWRDLCLRELGRLYSNAIQQLVGKPCCLIRNPPSLEQWDTNGLYILMALHKYVDEIPPDGSPYIVLQLEGILGGAFHHGYIDRMRKAHQVWDFNPHTTQYLRDVCGLTNVLYFPLGWCSPPFQDGLPAPLAAECRNDTVAFYGAIAERRQRALAHIQNLRVHIVIVNYSLFDDERDACLRDIPIVLNINYYDPHVLAEARIIPAMARGQLVISERSMNVELDREYEPYVVFVPGGDWDQMAKECAYWLEHQDERQRRVWAGCRWLQTQRHMCKLAPECLRNLAVLTEQPREERDDGSKA